MLHRISALDNLAHQSPQTIAKLQNIISNMPDSPGVYQFLNSEEKIIYVGKAKSLRKRVASYFTKKHDNLKIAVMVRKIAGIHITVVNSESDALLLERNMIREYQPRYNIALKDDKSYPWITVRTERFPRIYLMRNPVRDGSQYFGPYTSAGIVRRLLDLIRNIYRLRSCSLHLTAENIARGKYKTCLEYHLGNCKAPCEARQTEEEYSESVAQICSILQGNITGVIQHLKKMMDEYAGKYRFEEAEEMKNRILVLEKFRNRSTIVNPEINNVDVFSYEDDVQSAYVNCLRIVDGAVVQAQTVEILKRLDEQPAELLGYAITELRARFTSQSHEIIVPFHPDVLMPDLVYTIPADGDKKSLLELSHRNARAMQMEKKRAEENTDPDRHANRILETLMHDLHLNALPVHIECFDNSNIQGTHPVASCAVFRRARPSKRDYRHYNIKTVEGPNDYASMEEVVLRRYRRLLEEEQSLPQLIIIDGGKGQLSSAMKSLAALNLSGKIAIVGIAKRLEEIYFPGDSVPLYLDKRSESLKLIQQIRDEAHRFGIALHRNKRSQAMTDTELQNIKGIGPQTIEKLLRRFKSVERLKEASPEEIEKTAGKRKAAAILQHFSK